MVVDLKPLAQTLGGLVIGVWAIKQFGKLFGNEWLKLGAEFFGALGITFTGNRLLERGKPTLGLITQSAGLGALTISAVDLYNKFVLMVQGVPVLKYLPPVPPQTTILPEWYEAPTPAVESEPIPTVDQLFGAKEQTLVPQQV